MIYFKWLLTFSKQMSDWYKEEDFKKTGDAMTDIRAHQQGATHSFINSFTVTVIVISAELISWRWE